MRRHDRHASPAPYRTGKPQSDKCPDRVLVDLATGDRQVDVLPFAVVEFDNGFATGHAITGLLEVQADGAMGSGGESQASAAVLQ